MKTSIFIAVLALIQVTMGIRPIFHRRLEGDDGQNSLQQSQITSLKIHFSDDFKEFKRQYDTYSMQLPDIPNDYCKTNFIDIFEMLKDGDKTQDPQLHARYQQLVSLGNDHIESLMQLGLKDCQENLKRRLAAKGLTWAEMVPADKPKLISLYSDFLVQHMNSYQIFKKQFETYPVLVEMANIDTDDDIDGNDDEVAVVSCNRFVQMYEYMLAGMIGEYDQPQNEKAKKLLSHTIPQLDIMVFKVVLDDFISDTKIRDDMLRGMDYCAKNLRRSMEAIGLEWVECNPLCSKPKTTRVGVSNGWSCC